MSQKVVNVNNTLIAIDSDGFFSAANLRQASGRTDESSKFAKWFRTKAAKDLGGQICHSNNITSAVKQLGGRAGTWIHPELAWGYCEYLSAELHRIVVATFDAMTNNDVKKAKEIVRTAVRVEGIPVRKEVASKIMKYGDKTFIGDMTDAVNLYVTGKTAKGIRATRTEGFNKSTPTRDRMTDNELKAVTAIEALVALQIERDENKPDWMGRSSVRELVNNTGHTVRSMIQ